jgi:gentisate 1,2-dioxygenase
VSTFYDEWLDVGRRIEKAWKDSPIIARDSDIEWVSTRQDAKVKLMVGEELGFPTMGSCVLKAEIAPGWHTGRHRHGEESMYFLSGHGFTMIEDQRFDWRAGSAVHIPYRAAHQHFNLGDEPAQYVSGMCFPLERFVNLAKLEQLEDCGPTERTNSALSSVQETQYLRNGDRAVINVDEAPMQAGAEDGETATSEHAQNQHHSTWYLVQPSTGFNAKSVAVSHVFEEPAGYHGGRHKHLEAVLYVIEGEGYTEVEGRDQHWVTGDVMHVPPAMFEHEHYNDSAKAYRLLRIGFGMRQWFTAVWPEGYSPQRSRDENGLPIIAGRISRIRER